MRDEFVSLFVGNWLTGRVQGLCDKLQNDMEPCLNGFKTYGTTANDNYNRVAVNLNNPKIYQGKGAQAFLSAVNTDINRSSPLLVSFGHAASAAGTLGSSILDSSTRYDNRIAGISIPFTCSIPPLAVPARLFDKWRDNLINSFFVNMSNVAAGGNSDLLSDVLQNGAATMGPPWSAAVKTTQATVSSDAQQYVLSGNDSLTTSPPPGGTENAQLTPQEKKAQQTTFEAQMEKVFMEAFDSLSNDVHFHIWNWAGELHSNYLSFQSTMRNVNNLTAPILAGIITLGGTPSTIGRQTGPYTVTGTTLTDGMITTDGAAGASASTSSLLTDQFLPSSNNPQSNGNQSPQRAAVMSIPRTYANPEGTINVTDWQSADSNPAEGEDPITAIFPSLPLPFHVTSAVSYTLDIPINQPAGWHPPMAPYDPTNPNNPPLIYPTPVIRNITHSVDIVGGNLSNLPFSFTISSYVDVCSGDGTFLYRAWGNQISSIAPANDFGEAWFDPTPTKTTVPYQPIAAGPVPSGSPLLIPEVTLFILKHYFFITPSEGYIFGSGPQPPFTHNVNSVEPGDPPH